MGESRAVGSEIRATVDGGRKSLNRSHHPPSRCVQSRVLACTTTRRLRRFFFAFLGSGDLSEKGLRRLVAHLRHTRTRGLPTTRRRSSPGLLPFIGGLHKSRGGCEPRQRIVVASTGNCEPGFAAIEPRSQTRTPSRESQSRGQPSREQLSPRYCREAREWAEGGVASLSTCR